MPLELFGTLFNVRSQLIANFIIFQAELDVGFDETFLVPDIISLPLELFAVHGLILDHGAHRVRQLNFAALAGRRRVEVMKDGGREDIPPCKNQRKRYSTK